MRGLDAYLEVGGNDRAVAASLAGIVPTAPGGDEGGLYRHSWRKLPSKLFVHEILLHFNNQI